MPQERGELQELLGRAGAAEAAARSAAEEAASEAAGAAARAAPPPTWMPPWMPARCAVLQRLRFTAALACRHDSGWPDPK